jgi:glycosyltransferase involved in cell wall biosynthesis
MNYKISIILPFFYSHDKKFNKGKNFSLLAFEKCLTAIFKSYYRNYEVIAISDGSSKESIIIAEKYPCKIIKLKKNYGAAFSRNKGASISNGKILVFLDSDVEIKKNALSIINKFFDSKDKENVIQGVYSHKPNYKSSVTQYLHSYHCYHLFSETKNNKYTQTLCSAFFAIKKDLFIKYKGFDVKFNKASAEDADFGFKLIKNQHKITLERKLNAKHHIDFNILSFTKRIIRLHTDEMKMYLRNKSANLKVKQSNYSVVIFGIILIFFMTILIFINLFYPLFFFKKILIILNLIFMMIHKNFIIFVLSTKGLAVSLKAIFYIYLHRLLFSVCFFRGLIDFYILRNRY